MKIFIQSRDDLKEEINKLFPANEEVYHDQVEERYFTTVSSPSSGKPIGWLIPVSKNTREFLCQVEYLGRFRITHDHPIYMTLLFENDYD